MMKGNPITVVNSEQKRLATSKTVSLNPSAIVGRRLSDTWLNLADFLFSWNEKQKWMKQLNVKYTLCWFCRNERSRWSRQVSVMAAAAVVAVVDDYWPVGTDCTFRYLVLWHWIHWSEQNVCRQWFIKTLKYLGKVRKPSKATLSNPSLDEKLMELFVGRLDDIKTGDLNCCCCCCCFVAGWRIGVGWNSISLMSVAMTGSSSSKTWASLAWWTWGSFLVVILKLTTGLELPYCQSIMWCP